MALANTRLAGIVGRGDLLPVVGAPTNIDPMWAAAGGAQQPSLTDFRPNVSTPTAGGKASAAAGRLGLGNLIFITAALVAFYVWTRTHQL